MARVLKGFHSFTWTPTRSSAIGMSHTCLCLPSYNWYSFTDPGGMEGWIDLGWSIAQAEIRTCNLPIFTMHQHQMVSARFAELTGKYRRHRSLIFVSGALSTPKNFPLSWLPANTWSQKISGRLEPPYQVGGGSVLYKPFQAFHLLDGLPFHISQLCIKRC